MEEKQLTVFAEEQRKANLFANSSIVPDTFRQDVVGKDKAIANCYIALNMAKRMNADPFMIMQNIYIVHGKPSFSSSFLIATVNASGRYNPLKFKFATLGKDIEHNGKLYPNISCICYTSEKGSNEVLSSSVISMQLAINEGWLDKKGSKWVAFPDQMLRYRAAAFWVRTFCPEMAMGLHTQEEMETEKFEDVEVQEVKAKKQEATTNENTKQAPQPKYYINDIVEDIKQCKDKESLSNFLKMYENVLNIDSVKQAFEDKAKELSVNNSEPQQQQPIEEAIIIEDNNNEGGQQQIFNKDFDKK